MTPSSLGPPTLASCQYRGLQTAQANGILIPFTPPWQSSRGQFTLNSLPEQLFSLQLQLR